MTVSRHVGIVGGGLLGMTLAMRLRQDGCRVTLIEGAGAPGGLVSPQTIGGYRWDRFYHVILLSDSNLREVLGELGLDERIQWRTTRTGFYVDGALYSLSSSLEYLTFPPLSPWDKVRLAYTIWYAAHLEDWRPLEGILAIDWLRRLSGERVVERIWRPLLESKLGANYRLASASFIWAIIARLYAARRSGLKREMFGYVEGGYEQVLARLRQRIDELGIVVRCGKPVSRVIAEGDGVSVELSGDESLPFDDVVLTIPSSRAAALCPQLPVQERERLESVVYQGIVCASLLSRRPLASYYVTNITDRWVPFTAVIEMTTLVDPATFGGNTLVYLPRYLPQDDPFWLKGDDEIRDEFVAALERMYPHFTRADVVEFKVARVREMLAVTTLHYSDRTLPPMRTSLEHVFIANSAQIANGTLNANETIGIANEKARELSVWFGASTPRAARGVVESGV